MPSRDCSAAISARICTRSFASRFESGSSIRKTLGSPDDRAAHRDALALAARELAGLALEVRLEAEQLRDLARALLALGLRHLRDAQRERDVRGDGEVRIERVVLEDHRDVALLRRQVGDVAVADEDRAGVDLLEPGEHAQRRRLARARRADEDEELAVLDLEVERVDRRARPCRRRSASPARSARPPSAPPPAARAARRPRTAPCAGVACATASAPSASRREQRRADDRGRARPAQHEARADAAQAELDARRGAPGRRARISPPPTHDLDLLVRAARAVSTVARASATISVGEPVDDVGGDGVVRGRRAARPARARARAAARSRRVDRVRDGRAASRRRSAPARAARARVDRPAAVLAARGRGEPGDADVVAAAPVAGDRHRARGSARAGRPARRRRS